MLSPGKFSRALKYFYIKHNFLINSFNLMFQSLIFLCKRPVLCLYAFSKKYRLNTEKQGFMLYKDLEDALCDITIFLTYLIFFEEVF